MHHALPFNHFVVLRIIIGSTSSRSFILQLKISIPVTTIIKNCGAIINHIWNDQIVSNKGIVNLLKNYVTDVRSPDIACSRHPTYQAWEQQGSKNQLCTPSNRCLKPVASCNVGLVSCLATTQLHRNPAQHYSRSLAPRQRLPNT